MGLVSLFLGFLVLVIVPGGIADGGIASSGTGGGAASAPSPAFSQGFEDTGCSNAAFNGVTPNETVAPDCEAQPAPFGSYYLELNSTNVEQMLWANAIPDANAEHWLTMCFKPTMDPDAAGAHRANIEFNSQGATGGDANMYSLQLDDDDFRAYCSDTGAEIVVPNGSWFKLRFHIVESTGAFSIEAWWNGGSGVSSATCSGEAGQNVESFLIAAVNGTGGRDGEEIIGVDAIDYYGETQPGIPPDCW